jgi:hypothetical protein
MSDEWMTCMRRGDFAAAWALSDAVLASRAGVACAHLPRHEQWIWDGSSLQNRRVLVRCYHGLGDTLQFVRYLPLLQAIGSTVILWVQPALMPLLSGAGGIDEMLPLHDGVPDVAYDVDVELMELPHVFRSTRATIPARVPYLRVDRPPRPPEPGLRAGLVWVAGGWNQRRSIPSALLEPLREVAGVSWHLLQHGPALAGRPVGFGVPADVEGFVATARTMLALDLVITIDSVSAHLAGALGLPVWTLLPFEADWRWMEGERTPWYPTMRLFRQPGPGQWAPVIAHVARALAALAEPARE